MNVRLLAIRAVAGLILFASHTFSLAGMQYHFSWGTYGDTAWPADINDLGIVVWSGFCDGGCRSEIVGDYPYFVDLMGAQLSDINNEGDLFGSSLKNGISVPTVWIKGIPYDLSDPLNTGVAFKPDPGPKYASEFKLLDLDVVDLPSEFRPTLCTDCPPDGPWFDYGFGKNYYPPKYNPQGAVLTNARGDFVFEFSGLVWPTYGMLTATVSEPSSLGLIGIAGAMALALRSRRPRAPVVRP